LTPEAASIIGDIYDAALDPAGWDQIGAELCRAFDSISFLLVQQNRDDRNVAFLQTNWSAEQLGDYKSHFYEVDCWMEEGLRQPAMTPLSAEQYFPDQDFMRSELYFDFCRPNDIRHLLAEWAVTDGSMQCSLALLRSASAGAFDAAQVRLLGDLFPHVLRSIHLGARLNGARRGDGVCEIALNELGTGIVVVDQHSVVVMANRAAEAIAAARDGFALAAGRKDRAVAAATPQDTKRLRHLIARAAPDAARPAVGGAMRLHSAAGRRGYAVSVSPLPRAARGLHPGTAPLVLLLIRDLSLPVRPPERQLVELFGLTPAEARLVASLAQGTTRADYAATAGISALTVKTHMSRAFAKLGVNRESELVRLVLSLGRP
jgi:DNA-binding CsgD family transcriptional regulator/PAS domain-containing protein